MRESDPPTLPDTWLADGGWVLAETETETVFRGAGVSVTADTAVYEDAALRERITAAGGADRVWRFFFATRLSIRPSFALGLTSVVRPHVVRESNAAFAAELTERGCVDVEHGDTETVRLGDHRARMTPVRARLPLGDRDVGILGALVVWKNRRFHVAGGAYPTSGLDPVTEIDPDAYESELLELIRAVA